MKQIKTCLKNLFINLKYYFVPLGISMFFIIIAISVGVPLVVSSIKDTFTGISAELGGVEFDWPSAFNKIIEKVLTVDQSNGLDGVIKTVSDKDWVISTLTDVASALFGESVSGQEIVAMIRNCAQTIVTTFSLIAIMALTGFVIAFFVIMVAVRKGMAKVGWLKAILFSLIDTAILYFVSWVYLKIDPSAIWAKIVLNIVYVLVIVVFSFIESYLFYGIKKLKFKEVLNMKNILFWAIGNIIVLAIGIGLTIIPIVVIPWYGGYVLAIPFVEIVFLVLHINAEGYIGELAHEKKMQLKAEKAKAKVDAVNKK